MIIFKGCGHLEKMVDLCGFEVVKFDNLIALNRLEFFRTECGSASVRILKSNVFTNFANRKILTAHGYKKR